jgi:mono/diheme cytochrome c family protein
MWRENPDEQTSEVLPFADHCAGCHANNGSGDTTIGRNLYPKSPDMPAWGDGDADHNDAQDSHGTWALVHFIRHLPSITDDELAEMRSLNPTSPGHAAAAERERDGHESAPPAKKGHGHDHDHHH